MEGKLKRVLQYLNSFFLGSHIYTYHSSLNGQLDVCLYNGRLILNSENANLSFASLHKVFRKTFKRIDVGKWQPKQVLLLGLGGGSVPKIIYDELHLHCQMDAVEYDPVMIDIARTYFRADRFKQMDIIEADAYAYVQECGKQYDLIAVDIFNDAKVPPRFFDELFNTALLRLSCGYIVFNTITGDSTYARYLQQVKGFYERAGLMVEAYNVLQDNTVLIVDNCSSRH